MYIYVYIYIYIYMCVCCVCVCVCQGLWKGVCCLCICVHVLPSLKPTYNPAAENTPLGTMGKASGKKNRVAKTSVCKATPVDTATVAISAMAIPFRNLMRYRNSDRCVKAANNIEPVFCETGLCLSTA